jgi:O-antigen chain-terminating methyltransferase
LTTFSGAFYADPTHQRPIHPEAIRRMVELHGFGDVRIEYLNPIEESDKLEYLASESNTEPALRKMVETINRNLRRMNSLLYNYADYAVIGRKTV